MKLIHFKYLIISGAFLASPVLAQDIVYEPINPNFGGNPFNSAHLLGVANAINGYEDPDRTASGLGTSQADLFVRQLQSRLLSGLASNVTDAIFGDNPQDSGTIQFGSQTITFVRGLSSIRLTIFDSDTGTTTEIEIPILNVTGGTDSTGTSSATFSPQTIVTSGSDLTTETFGSSPFSDVMQIPEANSETN